MVAAAGVHLRASLAHGHPSAPPAFYCCDKHHSAKHLGVGRSLFSFQATTHHQSKTRQKLKAGTWKQELEKGQRKDSVYYLTLYVLLSLLSYTI